MKTRVHISRWLFCSLLLLTLMAVQCDNAPVPAGTPAPTLHVTAEGLVQGRVLPSPHFAPMLVRAPIAWARSAGAGVTVAVTCNHGEDTALVNLVAPGAQVEPLEMDPHMRVGWRDAARLLERRGVRILAIVEPADFDPQALRDGVQALIRAGVAVFVNGTLSDAPGQVTLVDDLEAAGAITVGGLDRRGCALGRDLAQRQINLFAPYGFAPPGVAFDRGAVLTAAGVGALVLAVEPALSPEALKQRLVDTADQMYQASIPETGEWTSATIRVDPQTGDYSPTELAFRLRRVNAASAVGVRLDERWLVNALNAPAAWETVTGQGVTVAVLDQGFHVDNPTFQGHVVDKATFFPGQDFGGYQNFHGTAMARLVLAVAPDASLVFLHHGERYDQIEAVIRAYADAIDYAVERGVDVITSSAAPWPNAPVVHAAIDRAIEAGVVVVWFHYHGHNDAVIRPGYFWDPRWEVGAMDRFLDDDKPSDLEGGMSCTAPQIAGIAALILENEPDLSPAEVKRRILETATVLPDGNSIADAAAAVDNRPSGRQLPGQDITRAPGGHCRVAIQQPGTDETTVVEVEEQGQHWPVPIWPRRDILLYRQSHSAGEQAAGNLRLEVYRDGDVWLVVEWSGGQLVSGASVAQLSVLPDGSAGPSCSVPLGEAGVLPLQVQVDGGWVRLSWEDTGGVPLECVRGGIGRTQPGYRLYRFEAETQRLPGLVETIY